MYSRGRGWGAVPKSNDALYKDINGRWFLVELKANLKQLIYIEKFMIV